MNQNTQSRGWHWVLTVYCAALVFLAGCATPQVAQKTPATSIPSGVGAPLSGLSKPVSIENLEIKDRNGPSVQKTVPKPESPAKYAGLTINGMKLENVQFDFPITIKSRVLYWVDYFQGRGRKHFVKYLERSEYFIPFIVPILKSHGMPEDLVYLAMIESGFNNHARSQAKAVGPWQFIPATGRRYGLMVNWWVDERRDTQKSTVAALEYLRDLYSMYQSWELAAASYNSGEAKIARAIRRYGTKDFWALARHRFLKPETRDYVPKIIAAAIVAKNRTQFGFDPPAGLPKPGEAVAGDGEVVKIEVGGNDQRDDLSSQGAEGKRRGSEVADSDNLKTLADEFEVSPEEVVTASLPLSAGANSQVEKARLIPMPVVSKQGVISGEQLAEFEVQSPADLLQVARASGLAYGTVKGLNPELTRWCTPPNVGSYRIKLPMQLRDKFLLEYNSPGYKRRVEFLAHKVANGDTIAKVARKFGIKVDPIADLNGISAKKTLRKGMRILLPVPTDRSRSLASLEVRDPPEKSKKKKKVGRRSRTGYRVSQADRQAAVAVKYYSH